MPELKVTVRVFGNKWGILLPKDQLQKEHFNIGDPIRLLILRKENPRKKT